MTDILSQFRDEDLPLSIVDIGGAVRAGRRRRRIRTGLVAGVMAVAVAVAVGTPIWLFARPDPAPPIGPDCGSPQPSRQSLPTWERFDPLRLEIDTSEVTGYRVVTSATATYGQLALLQADGPRGDEPEAGVVTVMLFACGGEPRYFDGDQPVPFDPGAGEPANPINGVSAYWLPSNKLFPGGSTNEGIAWQWTAGAWAMVVASPPPDTSDVDPKALRTVATQVAPRLDFGAGTPVTAPVSLPVPDGMYLSSTVTQRASDFGQEFPVGFRIGFDALGTSDLANPFISAEGYQPLLMVDASTFTTLDDRPDNATEYSEDLGYPAYQAVVNDGIRAVDALLVYDYFGFGLQIMPAELPGASTRDEKLSRAAEIFRTITVYPGAAGDLSAWGDPIVP